jgi:hypothetical protein
VFSLPWSREKKGSGELERSVSENVKWMFLCYWENRETLNSLMGNIPHKPVLVCATVVSFPRGRARAERQALVPRLCLVPSAPQTIAYLPKVFCSPLVLGQETTATQANQHKQNYPTVSFCCWSFIVFLQHFRCPGWKIDPFYRTETATGCLQPLV